MEKQKIMVTLIKFFILFLFSQLLNAQIVSGQDIVIKIDHIDNNKGNIYVAVYDSKDSFLDKRFKGTISEINQNSSEVTFKDVPEGVYAISLVHDENGNGKMDSNFLGIPSEDYGCSNNARSFMGPPKWEDAKFEVKARAITQTITL